MAQRVFRQGSQDEADAAVNPKEKVTALRFDDGDMLTESEGYVRDTRRGRKDAEALFYMISEVHARMTRLCALRTSKAAQEEAKRKACQALAATMSGWIGP